MTVIHGDSELLIGCKYHDWVTGPDMNWYQVAYKVIKEATLDELKKYIQEMDCTDTGNYGKFIYFVEMD